MKVNDNAGHLKHPGALELIASKLAPTAAVPPVRPPMNGTTACRELPSGGNERKARPFIVF